LEPLRKAPKNSTFDIPEQIHGQIHGDLYARDSEGTHPVRLMEFIDGVSRGQYPNDAVFDEETWKSHLII
jgi:hypothetical protein